MGKKWIENETYILESNINDLKEGDYSWTVSDWWGNSLVIDYNMLAVFRDDNDSYYIFFKQLPQSIQQELMSLQTKREEAFKKYFPNYKELLKEFQEENLSYYPFEIKSFLNRKLSSRNSDYQTTNLFDKDFSKILSLPGKY